MKQQPAGFWIRLQAHSIDTSLWLLTLTLPSWIMANRYRTLETIIPPTGALLFYLAFLYPALTLLYRVVLTMNIGGSIGKRLCGIKVVDEQGNLMGLKPLLFRYLIGYLVSGMLYGAGFLWIARDRQKRGWHDHISASRVIIDEPKRWILGTLAMLVLLFTLSFLVSSTVRSIKLNTGLHRDLQTIISEVQGRVLENSETPATIEPQKRELII